MSMFMASMRQAYHAGELRDDGMTSAWLRNAVEEYEAKSREIENLTAPSTLSQPKEA